MASSSLEIRDLNSEDVWDHENGYFWFSEPSRLNKALAQYDLYKMIVDLPGDVFEFGVFKGLSLIRFATFRNFMEDQTSRRIVGFDTFGKFPTTNIHSGDDLKFVDAYASEAGDALAKQDLEIILERKGFSNTKLIEGNVFDTLPEYLSNNPATRISLLHLDMDVMEPTDFALELLYDRVVKGGIIMFDDYQAVAGATISVDRFIEKTGLKLEKLPYYRQPAFVRKL
ncbi:dTDP-6-deoxy-L-hexose 3-O-methyltransferase [Roseibium polysiphoniae]|uniref:dTDP-6-deoxy-L-hexose 3-O-methyltransferase n=1 Tax=Roseibium polysiphoniae TaxID=2571221 RepID=A0A944C7N6_9HYPH|nr:TylF/MycF/NovP-related O-methyltransferase [Roseibium polysiphoniae]MBS8259076.1 dTDP-6-deoxy-L-hexose 3-O-methyltransferase [Roseibium polysiphoniae]